MTCRQANPKIRIVAKTQDVKLSHRIKSAGADAVVSPQFIGGMRLVSEMVRPTVVSFLDLMLRDMDKAMRVEEVEVQPGSELAGTRLVDRIIASSNVLVMALKEPGGDKFLYVPPSNALLRPGYTLVVLGETVAVARLKEAGTGTVPA
jgi:voltage-gated potassium channel